MTERNWTAKWIGLSSYKWAKNASPVPLVFQRQLNLPHNIVRAVAYVSAIGIYEFAIDGKKVGDLWFTPGFTSYQHQIQYQKYDVTGLLKRDSILTATVAGGWAVGAFNYNRKSRIASDHQAFLCEIEIEYLGGERGVINTDGSWDVTTDGPVRAANFYDGEMYDATRSPERIRWEKTEIISPRGRPKLYEQYGAPVKIYKEMRPIAHFTAGSGEVIYDFGQNFAGVIVFKLRGQAGQRLIFRHAELLKDHELYTEPLRTAKQTVTYICRSGEQEYSPHFTYMGFRYVGMRGADAGDIELWAYALSSELKEVGAFECSDTRLNRLNENIRWSARSNFIDIPTDCPQRDERLGWTGDIALFASTACFHYDMSSFFGKWLLDLRSEQSKSGGIPMVVPRNGHEWPPFTTACWGDSCILVPWAEYLSTGDTALLRTSYPSMKRFLRSVKWWAGLFSFGKKRYIWKYLFQYGDWCAPQDPPEPWPRCVKTWMKRGKWIATAYYANSCGIMAEIAALIGEPEDAAYYEDLRQKICTAFRDVFTDGNGKLHQEFQTGYALPLYFGMTDGSETNQMADHLDRLVMENGDKLTTGFPGTPYLLFALSDHGHLDRAYRLLMQEECPSWLYEVKMGATTVWERWDAIAPDGSMGRDAMCSCNHYAYGAVGDWLYRRVLGIEAASGGYKTFKIAPMPGGGLTYARGHHDTPWGRIVSDWKIEGGEFCISVEVPFGTTCQLRMPGGKEYTLNGGSYSYKEIFGKEEDLP